MPEKIQNSEIYQFLIKVILPAVLAVTVKIAIEMKTDKGKVSALNIILSMLIGVGGAYLASPIIIKNCPPDYLPLSIALVAMSTEKIGAWVIYKLNFDVFLTALVNGFFEYISNLFNKKI